MTTGRLRLLGTNNMPLATGLAIDLETGEIRIGNPEDDWFDCRPVPARRTVSASYRALRGVRADITPAVTTGAYDTDGMTVIGWGSAAGKYRFVGTTPTGFSLDPSAAVNENALAAAFNTVVTEFWTNSDDVRLYTYTSSGQKQDLWVLVDDMRIAAPGSYTHVSNAENLATLKLTAESVAWRKWRIHGSTIHYGIGVTEGSLIVPTTAGFQVAVIGDSYVQGASVDNAVSAGVAGSVSAGTLFGQLEQLTGLDVWRFGIGSTGYIAQGGLGADGPYGSAARIAKLAAAPDMDAVVVLGSVNDGAQTAEALTAAANAAWTAIKAAQPDAPLIVMGIQPVKPTDATLSALNTALIMAAQAHDDVDAVIDLRGHSIITGTGKDGTAAGDGNADVFTAADNTHLTHAGHDHVGEHIARLLGTVLVSGESGY